ncbi:uncharacterized protein [Pleurodeles waltl]|uniref:uncharacterized protein isoform X2 n=1 Tax=Pleurodeles waltl TaxID=8319 RepID=UPI003709C0F4
MEAAPASPADKKWTVRQTHTLLDLIRDLGLAGLLNRRGFQNREVFERLQAVLRRCNLRFSVEQIKDRWQKLKIKYWKLKKILETSEATAPGLLADFPYFDELELLLGVQSTVMPCKREADSSGLVSPVEVEDDTLDAEQSNSGEEDLSLGDYDLLPEEIERSLVEEMEGINLPVPEGASAANQIQGHLESRQNQTQPAADPSPAQQLQQSHEQLLLQQEHAEMMENLVASMDSMVKVVERMVTVVEQTSLQMNHLSDLIMKFFAKDASKEEQRLADSVSDPTFSQTSPGSPQQESGISPASTSLSSKPVEEGVGQGKSPRCKSRRASSHSLVVPRRSDRERRPSARFYM